MAADSDGNAQRLTCPECGRTFSTPAALGAHRSRVHGVKGTSRASQPRRRTRARAAAQTRSRTTRAPRATTTQATVDRDKLLQALFPNGVPARESTLRAVAAWLDEAERLARSR